MKTTINFYEFSRWFEQSSNYCNNFSRAGLRSLYDYFEQYEEDSGQEITFDPIAFCCEYTEYDNLQEFKENYTAEEYQVDDYNKLWEYTQVIPIDKESFIIQDF